MWYDKLTFLRPVSSILAGVKDDGIVKDDVEVYSTGTIAQGRDPANINLYMFKEGEQI